MNGRTLVETVCVGALALAVTAATADAAATSATIAPRLSPDRTGARAALEVEVRYGGGPNGVPLPVRSAVVRLPAGLTMDIPRLRICSAARLQALGPRGCPPASRLGGGHALVEQQLGSRLVVEPVSLSVFLGPLEQTGPTIEVLAEGSQPFGAQLLLTATAQPDGGMYGERLAMSVPLVESLPGAPPASLTSLTLVLGGRHQPNAVIVPSHCPHGGFPLAAQFLYADGSTSTAHAAIPCPPRRSGRAKVATRAREVRRRRVPARAARSREVHGRGVRARAARTVFLTESGQLRLTSRQGFTLNEQGAARGTVGGTIYVHLRIVSSSRVTAEVSIYRSGGSITGHGSASYKRGSSQASFSGSFSIDRGSGAYAHAKGADLSFGGTIQRTSYAIYVHVSGRVSV